MSYRSDIRCPKRARAGARVGTRTNTAPFIVPIQPPPESGGGRLHRLSEYPRSFVSPNRNEKKRGNPAVRLWALSSWQSLFAVIVALHEVGHLVPAKLFNVRVPQYMIGFGKTVFSFRRGETEYGFKAIPLGGYISMIGMYPPSPAEVKEHHEEGHSGRYQPVCVHG